MATFLSPDQLKKIHDDAEMAKAREALEKKRTLDQTAADLKRAFESREIAPQAIDRINTAVRAAAERGEHEVLVLQFPSTYCNDGGRSINNFEKEWASSLEGFGKTAYDFFEKELRPLGFKMRAEIISFPNGMPGDVGLYLAW